MKRFTRKEIPAKTLLVHTSTVCDLCGDETTNNWAPGTSALETKVSMKDGWNSPDGGQGTKISYDICPDCFKEKLIPWLESQGAKTNVEEWDW